MPNIPFPNVPKVSGVPNLPRLPSASVIGSSLLGSTQGMLWRLFQTETEWGIFDSKGKQLADPSKITGFSGRLLEGLGIGSTLSTNSVDYSKEAPISDFPVERGKFASYNKVEKPATPNVSLCFTGSEKQRKAFLRDIDAACKSTELYTIVTPEVYYINHSIERYAYQRRSSRGATLLLVEISLKEVRQVSSQYTTKIIQQSKDAGAASQEDNGKVQPKEPEKSTLQKVADKVTGFLGG